MDEDNKNKKNEGRKQLVKSILVSGAFGGAASTIDRATSLSTAKTAERVAKKYKNRQKKKGVGSSPIPAKNLTGVGFKAIVVLALLKDISDIFLTASFIFTILIVGTGIAISFIISLYLFMNGVSFNTKKLVTILLMVVIEMMPFLSVLPMATIGLFLVKKFENSERLQKFVGKNKKVTRLMKTV